jgi:tetratricopeptide (TPR) repeat protein
MRQPEARLETRVAEAEAAFQAGEFERGRSIFEEAVAQSPSDLVLLAKYAQMMVRTGQGDAAFNLLEDKAEALERSEDYDGASYCLEQVVELKPERITPLLKLGRLQCLARNPQRAWNTFSRAIDLVTTEETPRTEKEQVANAVEDCLSRLPDHTDVWERVLELDVELERRTQALEALKAIHRLAHQTGRTLEAVDALQRCVDLYPLRVRKTEWRAPQAWVEDDNSIEWISADPNGIDESNDPEEVKAHLRYRLELGTYHLRHGLQEEGTRVLVVAGEVARIEGFWKQANRLYLESLKWLKNLGERSGQRTVWHGLVEVGIATGEQDAARRSIRSWAAWEEEQGELDRALDVRETYLQSEPKDLSVREDLVSRAWEWGAAERAWENSLVLAEHLKEKDLFGRAEALYRGLMQRARDPKYAESIGARINEARAPLLQLLRDRGDQAAVAELQRAEAQEAERAGDYAAAASILEEVLAQREQDAGLREELVHCLRRAGQEEAALEHQLQLARFHRSSGMIGKALEMGRQVARARPDDEETLGFLTANYREAGEIREACEFYWSIVRDLETEDPVRAKPALHQIETLAQRSPETWVKLGEAWMRLDEKEKAGRAYHRAGTLILETGTAPEAEKVLRKAAEVLPEDAQIQQMLEKVVDGLEKKEAEEQAEDLVAAAERAKKQGDRTEACRLLDEYVGRNPEDIAAREKLVDLLVGLTGRRDDLAGATAALNPRQKERLTELCDGLAEHYLQAEDTLQAVRYIRITAELAPDRLDLQRSLMEHYTALGLQSEAARQGLDLAERLTRDGNSSGAVSVYRDLLELDPSNLEARNALAVQLVENGNTDEARAEYRKLAEGYTQKELLGKAIASLQSALSLDPEDEDLRREMARLFALKGNVGAALAELKTVEERCEQRGELDRAADVLAEMVRLDPERGSSRERLARIHMERGDRRHARESYRDLALLYRERELPGRMIEATRRALDIEGDDEELSRMMVEAYRERGDLRLALEEARRMAGIAMQRSAADGERLYRDVLSWESEDVETLQALAGCCERQHRDSEASDHLEHLGRVYQTQGRYLEATGAWTKALELNSRKVALKEELAEAFFDLGDEYHGHLLLEELAEHYETLGEYEEAVNRWVRLADRHIQKAMELPA